MHKNHFSKNVFFITTVVSITSLLFTGFSIGGTLTVHAQEEFTVTPTFTESPPVIMETPVENTPTFEATVELIATPTLTITPTVTTYTATPTATRFQRNTKTPRKNPKAEIVGGADATSGQFPWQVRLTIPATNPKYFTQLCGGVLIDPRWVLTAAHCVKDVPKSSFVVTLGIYNLDKQEFQQSRRVVDIFIHKDYTPVSSSHPPYNDIALLELDKSIELTEQVQVIPLIASTNNSLVGTGVMATVSGWGSLDRYNILPSYPKVLQYIKIPIISDTECSKIGGTSNMLCAGYPEKYMVTCPGDSGGPLVVPDGTNWRLAGIVSWGQLDWFRFSCQGYSAFTRVSKYIDWINKYVHNPALQGSFQLIPRNSQSNSYCLDVQGGIDAKTKGANVYVYSCRGASQTNQLWRLVPVGSYYQIRAIHSDKCLDVSGGVNAKGNGANVHQWDCLGVSQTNQLWKIVSIGNDYQIRAVHSNKCLDVSNGTGKPQNSTNVHQWECLGAGQINQLWQIVPVGDFKLIPQHSGKCLDVSGGTQAIGNGANVQQWACGVSQPNQLWRPIYVGNGLYQIMAIHSGKCLDVSGYSTANGGNVHQWKCGTNQANQQWRFIPVNNSFKLISQNSGKCLDVAGGTKATGNAANVQQYGCGASQLNQMWQLK